MRLINADKLKEAVEYSRDVKIGYLNHCAEAGYNPDNKDRIETNIKWHEDILKLIDNTPTIEAQPKLGKWINGHWDGDSNFHIDGRGNCWFVRECSNCHEEIQGKPTNFCPNCGAKMLKEGKGHD